MRQQPTPSPTPSGGGYACSAANMPRFSPTGSNTLGESIYSDHENLSLAYDYNAYMGLERDLLRQRAAYMTPEPVLYDSAAGMADAVFTKHHHITPRSSPASQQSNDSRTRRSRASTPSQIRGVKASRVSKPSKAKVATEITLPAASFSQQVSQAAWQAVVTKTEAHVGRPHEARQTDQINKKGCVKRPWNTYVLYRWAFSNLIKELYPKSGQQDVSRVASSSWKQEPPNIREFFASMAEKEKQEHKQAFPGYVYQPNKNNDASVTQFSRHASVDVDIDDPSWHPTYPITAQSSKAAWQDLPEWMSNPIEFTSAVTDMPFDQGPVPSYIDPPSMQTFAHDQQVQDLHERTCIDPSRLYDGPYYIDQPHEEPYPPLPSLDQVVSPYYCEELSANDGAVRLAECAQPEAFTLGDINFLADPNHWDSENLESDFLYGQ